jgi:hypothetical protein
MIKHILKFFFGKHGTSTDIHTRTITHPYEHMHAHPTSMNTFKRLSRLDIETYEVGHQECIAVDGDAGFQ